MNRKKAANNDHNAAARHLRKADRRLRSVINQVGPCQLAARGGRFELLARSILSQQISVAAARTIRRNLQSQLPGRRLSATALAALSDADFQAAGVSRQKRGYLRDLAVRVTGGQLSFRRIAKLDEVAVIEELTQVKGIGVWTAQMFLMFGLGRPDVFAPDDLGLRNAMIRIYDLQQPSKDELVNIAEVWSPWRSVASWYLWRSLENTPDTA